jgi:VanZ family protein
VICLESTEYASAANTFGLLYRTLRLLHIPIDFRLLFELNHLLRKSGHFIGYAILSVLTFFALRNTYRDRIRPRLQQEWGTMLSDLWRPAWSAGAMLLTIVTASADEIHQTFLPSRTGRWQDVMIDSSGALLAQFLLYLLAWWTVQRQQARTVELSLNR